MSLSREPDELLCGIHDRYLPCRPCLRAEGFYDRYDALDEISALTERTGGYDDDF